MERGLHVCAYKCVNCVICFHIDLLAIPTENKALQRRCMFNKIACSFEDVSQGRKVPGVIEEFWGNKRLLCVDETVQGRHARASIMGRTNGEAESMSTVPPIGRNVYWSAGRHNGCGSSRLTSFRTKEDANDRHVIARRRNWLYVD